MKPLLYTLILTVFGACSGPIRPFYALCAYVSLAIVKPTSLWGWALPHLPYSQIVAIPMLIGWLAGGSAIWRLGPAKPAVYCFAGFFCWGSLSALLAENHSLSLTFTNEMAKVLLPFLVGITTINSYRELRIFCWVIALSVGFVAWEMNVSYMAGLNWIRTGSVGLDNNTMAISMVTATGFALMLGLHTADRKKKLLAVFCSALMAHCVLLSDSRGGMLAMVVVGAAVAIITPKRPGIIFTFIIIGLLLLRFTGPAVVERFNTVFAEEDERDASAQSRVELWKSCATLIAQKPLQGVGPFHWREYYAQRMGWNSGKSAHSSWFELGAEIGIPGLLMLFGLYGITSFQSWTFIHRSNITSDPTILAACSATLVGLIGYGVSASFVTYWGNELSFYVALTGCAAIRLHELSRVTVQPSTLATRKDVRQPATA